LFSYRPTRNVKTRQSQTAAKPPPARQKKGSSRKAELRKYRSLFIAQGDSIANREEGSQSITALRANVENERKQHNQSPRKKVNSSEGHP
jgi:hypothetical protein